MKNVNGIRILKKDAMALARASKREDINTLYIDFNSEPYKMMGGEVPVNKAYFINKNNKIIYCKTRNIDSFVDTKSVKEIANVFYERMTHFARIIKK